MESQDAYGAIRGELIERGATELEIDALDAAFAADVKAQANISEEDPNTLARAEQTEAALERITEVASEPNEDFIDGVRPLKTTRFEGTNGADPVSIMILENANGFGEDSDGHARAVTNVVETQLQEAGQGYELITLEEMQGLDFNLSTNPGLDRIAAAAPDYANVSRGAADSFEFFNDTFDALRAEGIDLVAGLDPDVPMTADNLDDFVDTVRNIAANADNLPMLAKPGAWTKIRDKITAYENIAAAGTDLFVACLMMRTPWTRLCSRRMTACPAVLPGSAMSALCHLWKTTISGCRVRRCPTITLAKGACLPEPKRRTTGARASMFMLPASRPSG